jgi:ABC-type uncharacterized transport system permease subunit
MGTNVYRRRAVSMTFAGATLVVVGLVCMVDALMLLDDLLQHHLQAFSYYKQYQRQVTPIVLTSLAALLSFTVGLYLLGRRSNRRKRPEAS